MGWIFLTLAGIAEIAMTTAMRYFTWPLKPLPVIAFLLMSNLSFALLAIASQTIPLGMSYAIWTGIGAAGTMIVGIYWYGEAFTTLQLIFLTTLIASVVGLKLVSP